MGYQIIMSLLEKLLKNWQKNIDSYKNINEKAALMLADNKVLARCAGRSEFDKSFGK